LRKRPLSLLFVVSVVVAMAACGKKGPPLAPFSSLPTAVTDLSARQVGSELVFQFTVPASNVDGRRPANLDRVELYLHSTRQRLPDDYVNRGRLAGSVKVRRPPPPESETREPPPPPEPGVEQGTRATITAMPDFFVPQVQKRPVAAPADGPFAPLFPDGGGPLLSPRLSAAGTRLFIVAGVNRRGRFGPPSQVLEIPIVTSPPAPGSVQVAYTEQAFVLTWMPPSVAKGRPIQEPTPRGGALASRPLSTFSSPRAYNVYEVDRSAAPAGASSPVSALLNPMPLAEPRFEDARMAFGVERCFEVRTREAVGTFVVESASSPVTCVTPVDTFAPAAPRNLIGVSSEGSVNLLWDPNTEADLAGYLVLRGEGAGEKLQQLTKTPITETTYRDTAVQSGMMYVYVVVAVDKVGNVGGQSNRFEPGR
jgi:predicted small lipoprotein YifL